MDDVILAESGIKPTDHNEILNYLAAKVFFFFDFLFLYFRKKKKKKKKGWNVSRSSNRSMET